MRRKALRLLESYEKTGRIDRESVEDLEALRKLGALTGKPRRGGLYLFLIFLGLAALGVALLSLLRMPTTAIELIVESTDVGFRTLGGPQLVVERLDFGEVDFIDVASASLSNARPVRNEDGSSFAFELTASPPGDITLDQLLLPAGSGVYLSTEGQSRVYEAAVVSDTLELELELNGAEGLSVSPLPSALDLEDGSLLVRGVPFLGTPEEDDELLRFDFSAIGAARLAQQTQVAALDFTRAEVFSDTQNTLNTLVSGIESGTLYLEELNGRELTLRPGEPLRLGGVSGTLRAVELEHGSMSAQFRGTVRSLEIGFGDRSRNLMPTPLEWLQARTSLMTLLSGAVALLGVLAAFLEWWRGRRSVD